MKIKVVDWVTVIMLILCALLIVWVVISFADVAIHNILEIPNTNQLNFFQVILKIF